MEKKNRTPAWRTVLVVLLLGAYMLAGAWLLRGNEQMFGTLVFGLGTLGLGQAGKSGWEAHVNAKAETAAEPAK
jgi:hypothetical protein